MITTKYTAIEMAETLHRMAMKHAIKASYCEVLDEHMGQFPTRVSWDCYQVLYKENARQYDYLKHLAFEMGCPIPYHKYSIARAVGASMAHRFMERRNRERGAA